MKNLDIIGSNEKNMLSRTLNNTYQLYSELQSDVIIVNYGDSFQETIILNSSKLII